jgi:sugar phosphate isomerase/epimerase
MMTRKDRKPMKLNRRAFLKTTLALPALAAAPRRSLLLAGEKPRAYTVGICDWGVRGEAGKPGSFEVAQSLGFQGVQVSYQPEGEFSLSKKENRARFAEAARKSGMAITSLAMGLFNQHPFATTPDAEAWVADCMDAMDALKVKNVLLAFFGNGEIKDKPDQQTRVIEKLKRLTPKAEKLGLTLSIESYLQAEEHIKIIDAIGSEAVKVYYDSQNMANKGYDVLKDMAILAKRNLISETHLKDDSHRLEDSPLNYATIAQTLEDNGYFGWVVLESSVSGDWKTSQAANARYAKKIFHISET